VQSRIDEGTTVAVALPLAFTAPAQPPKSNVATLKAPRNGQHDNLVQVKKSA